MAGTRRISEYKVVKPPPPPYLSKETLIIWESWSKKGDREVARESAAKGSHTDLAQTFLSQRKGISLVEAENWFHTEIRNWASELLTNKQVFRASHILANIQLDPIKEIQQIFADTLNKDMRDFLGNHLSKVGSLENDHKQSWELLRIIDECADLQLGVEVDNLNVKLVTEKNLEWKNLLAAEIFLLTININSSFRKTCDSRMKNREFLNLWVNEQYSENFSFLKPECLWKSALRMKDSDFLSLWINVQYSEQVVETETNLELIDFLKKSSINQVMLDYLYYDENVHREIWSTVCDNLAVYGIFSNEEGKDLQKVLSRVTSIKRMHDLDDMLKSKCGNVSREKLQSLIFDYCVERELYVVLDICTKNYTLIGGNEIIDLIGSHRDIAKNINDKDKLVNNLLLSMKHFRDYEDKQMDSVIKVLILLLKNENGLFSILLDSSKSQLGFDYAAILTNLKVLNVIFCKVMKNCETSRLNMYDLLSKHTHITPEKVFLIDGEIPHFNQNYLVQNHGYNKKLDYKYYLTEKRPSMASILIQQPDPGIKERVTKLAMKNIDKKDVLASCVAFLEMIGESSDALRIDIKLSELIWNSGLYEKHDDLIKILLSGNDSSSVLNKIETELYSKFEFSSEYNHIIEAIRLFDVFYKYSESHELPLPNALLKSLAEKDLWLPFLVIIQKYNYTQEQLSKLVQNFNDKKLLEHLYHCIVHDIQYEHKNSIMRERDSRNYFLSRIGVRKNRDSDPMTSSATSQSSYGSTSSSGLSDYSDIEVLDLNSVDLLQVLIKCHNSGDPPKALLHACVYYKYPLFAILATSYEPDSVITNWLTWLAVTCNMTAGDSYEGMALVGNDVIDFMKSILQQGYYKTLKQSFHIFLSDNPLNLFMSILSNCISFNYKMTTLQEKLEKFHNLLKFRRTNSIITEIDHELTYLNSKIWLENTALVLLASALQHNFKTTYNKIQFLKVISELNLQNYFCVDLPNFSSIEKILTYLYNARISINIDYFKICDVATHKAEVISCISKLVNKGMFEEALKVADIADSAADTILTQKWKQIFLKNGISQSLSECDLEFRRLKVIPKNAVIFYVHCPMENDHDKYKVLTVAYQWASEYGLDEEVDLERDMWKSYLKLNDSYTHEIHYKNKNMKLYSDMKVELDELVVETRSVPFSAHEINRLDLLINQLLQAGDVFQAFKLERMFGHINSNLDLLRLCFNLAEGLTLPFQMNTQERLLLRKGYHFRSYSHRMKTLRPTRLSSLSSASRSPGSMSVTTVLEVEETVVQDTLALIENLIDGLTSGFEISQNVLMVYRISNNIDKKYSSIIETADPEPLLLEALENNCKNKLEVVHDFILVYKWSKQKISDFLCEQIISMIARCTEKNKNFSKLWDINLDTDIHLILQLLPDTCSILGNKLYNYASALHKLQTVSNEYPNINEITYVVELLIKAHDCYTADCNMEGISVILKKCQTLINLLLTMKNWKLIVRLLTGVARYNELNYVFHILRENDQFEYLLRRGKSNIKDNGLKVALLEYLKRYCPDNRELYRMVALHFTLYSEVAQLWENESASIIRNLIAISRLEMQNRKINPDTCLLVELTNTDGTKLCLNKAMENYSHAAEYHLQGDKLAKAMNAARQAELVALQMSLLKGLSSSGTATCILSLNCTQITTLILKGLSFPQALILTEAYEHPTDWAAVLFEQYILNNCINYLANFLTVFSLSDSLVSDIARRFLTGNINTDSAIHNMKYILKMLPSVHTKYRVASELGFLDIVEDLLNTNKLMYLKDTVWKKGYKN